MNSKKLSTWLTATACGCLLSAGAWAAGTAVAGDAPTPQQRYERERAACMAGKSGEDQATCLREAGAARQAALESKLHMHGEDAGAYAQNALQRCSVFKDAEDKLACEARVSGMGDTSGSVRQGGTITELTVTEIGQPPEKSAEQPSSGPAHGKPSLPPPGESDTGKPR